MRGSGGSEARSDHRAEPDGAEVRQHVDPEPSIRPINEQVPYLSSRVSRAPHRDGSLGGEGTSLDRSGSTVAQNLLQLWGSGRTTHPSVPRLSATHFPGRFPLQEEPTLPGPIGSHETGPRLDGNSPLPRLTYVAGYGRSGSTLLDLLLGNHPVVFGAGEVSRLFWDIAEGRPCSCGSLHLECDVWAPVLRLAMPGRGRSDYMDLRRRHLSAQMRRRESAFPEYREAWVRVFQAIRAVTGCQVVVDSSKSARRARHRRLLLQELCGLETRVIHLVRDPRAVMWSAARGSNHRIEEGLPPRRLEEVRALLHWTYTNRHVVKECREAGVDASLLRYEDLVRDPAASLDRICRFIGVDPSPLLTQLEEGRDFEPGHGVGGNRFRKRGPVVLRADAEWERRLPLRHRILSHLSVPVASPLGYFGRRGTSTPDG